MTYHQQTDKGVALCNGKVPNLRRATLTPRVASVTCNRCKLALNNAARAMKGKTVLREVLGDRASR